MNDDRAPLAVDRQVRQDHRLRGREVPVVARRLLVEPAQPAGLRVERHDAREVELVAAPRRTLDRVVRPAVAGADQHEPGLGVVVDRIPRGAAAADIPAAVGVPGRDRALEIGVILRSQLWIARHDPEAPLELARSRGRTRSRSRARRTPRRRCRSRRRRQPLPARPSRSSRDCGRRRRRSSRRPHRSWRRARTSSRRAPTRTPCRARPRRRDWPCRSRPCG